MTTEPHVHEHAHDGAPPHVHPHAHDPSMPAALPADGEPARGTVDLEHVHFQYPDGFEALRGVDLRIGAGEKVGLGGAASAMGACKA